MKLRNLTPGTTILTPWGKQADKRPVTFNAADIDKSSGKVNVSYTDQHGNIWHADCDIDQDAEFPAPVEA